MLEKEILVKKLSGDAQTELYKKVLDNSFKTEDNRSFYSSNSVKIIETLENLDEEVRYYSEIATKKTVESKKAMSLFKFTVRWMALLQKGIHIADYLNKYDYNSVAIYGMHYLGERLYDDLENSAIKVICSIDKNGKMQYKTLDNYTNAAEMPKVDVIIVTPITFYEDIKKELNKLVNYNVISLEEIVTELEEDY